MGEVGGGDEGGNSLPRAKGLDGALYDGMILLDIPFDKGVGVEPEDRRVGSELGIMAGEVRLRGRVGRTGDVLDIVAIGLSGGGGEGP